MSTVDEAPETVSPLIAKLQAHKAANAGTDTLTLPVTGIVATFPRFRAHGLIMRAARHAKGDAQKMQVVYIAQNVLFDGEKLRLDQIEELLPDDDSAALIRCLFVGDEDAEGNGRPTA